MRVIDLLNKIANGEEVPRKFKYENITFIYNDEAVEYFDEKEGNSFNYTFDLTDHDVLNDEIEIIEEDKKIENIKVKSNFTHNQKQIVRKINEIIDIVNKLKDDRK